MEIKLLHQPYCYDPVSHKFYENTMREPVQGSNGTEAAAAYNIVCSLKNEQNGICGNMRGIVLKLTDLCNMSCTYCPHSQKENTHMKAHANDAMPEKTVLQGIDCLRLHSSDSGEVDIVFFGGEPLTAFQLMKKAVFYAEETLKGKKITFNTTTNLLLLNDEMISFFAAHRFCICVSIDGPKEIHDQNRVNKGGRGTFDTVFHHFLKLKNGLHGTDSTVRINAVMDDRYDYRLYESFFSREEFSDIPVEMNPIDYSGSVSPPPENPAYQWQTAYARFLVYLCISGRFPSERLPLTARCFLNRLRNLYQKIKYPNPMPPSETYIRSYDYMAHGFFAFLNPQGNYYPGVHVNDKQEELIIGNAETGIQYEKIHSLFTRSSEYMKSCRSCPYLPFCQVPIALVLDAKGDAQRLHETYCRNYQQLWKEAASLLLLEQNILTDASALDRMTARFSDMDHKAAFTGFVESVFRTDHFTNRPVLSETDGISPVELVYLVCLIERIYDIRFEPDDFNDFQFGTFDGIRTAIKKYFRSGKQ